MGCLACLVRIAERGLNGFLPKLVGRGVVLLEASRKVPQLRRLRRGQVRRQSLLRIYSKNGLSASAALAGGNGHREVSEGHRKPVDCRFSLAWRPSCIPA